MRRAFLIHLAPLGALTLVCCTSAAITPSDAGSGANTSGSSSGNGGGSGTGSNSGVSAGSGSGTGASTGSGTGSSGTASGGGSGGSGTGGASGSVAEGGVGAEGGAGPPCSTTAGVNQANLTVRRPEIGTKKWALAAKDVIRIDHDPMTGVIEYMSRSGKFWKFDPATGTSAPAEAGYAVTGDHRGMAFGPDGSLYTVSIPAPISVRISKGSPGATRTWTTMATSDTYPPGGSNYDHSFAGIVADSQYVYFSSGSRTDHEELEKGLRNVPLTRRIFRLKTTDTGVVLKNDEASLAPYLYADGLRNAFDMAFNANGDLIAVDNGPDIDFSDEINWIQQGKHYGFPWRFGDQANVALDPAYKPAGDTRLHTGLQAVDKGTYLYDPGLMMPPAGVTFVDPIPNHGPDQTKYHIDRASATILDAAQMGKTLAGITAHRSPLGLAFDTTGALCGDYNKAGFVLSYGAVLDVMGDRGNDIALMQLNKVNGNYEMNLTQLVGFGTTATLIDSTLVGNKLYAVELGGSIYEITLPVKQ